MDGVIVHSNPVHRQAWIEFNRSHGIQTTDEMLARMYGKRNDEIVRDFFSANLNDREVFDLGAAKEALYREMIEPDLPQLLVPGIREFLNNHQDYTTAVATNAEAANADFVLDRLGLRSCFRIVVNGHQVTHAKPHPEIYLRAANLLEVDPDACVVFEDSHAGVAAGIAAGMPVIGIGTTHNELPGTVFTVPDFRSAAINDWLERSRAADNS